LLYDPQPAHRCLGAAQCSSGIIAFLSSSPSSVKEYSTLGGISANDSLLTIPSACSSLRVSASVFGLMFPSCCISALNLSFPWFPIALTMSRDHFLPMTSITPSRGHRHMGLFCSSNFSLSWGILAILTQSRYFTINLIS